MELKHEVSVGNLILFAILLFFLSLILLEIVYFENKLTEVITLLNHLT